MHELSLCMALMEQVEAIAREQGARKVTGITLTIGPLSGVEPELLRNAYPLAVAGTVAEDAELVVQSADVVVRCKQCDSETTVPTNRLLCGNCSSPRTQVVTGDELTLQRVELERSG